jgi:hypothetical protein
MFLMLAVLWERQSLEELGKVNSYHKSAKRLDFGIGLCEAWIDASA